MYGRARGLPPGGYGMGGGRVDSLLFEELESPHPLESMTHDPVPGTDNGLSVDELEGEWDEGEWTGSEVDDLAPDWESPAVFDREGPSDDVSRGLSSLAIRSIKEWPRSALRKGKWLQAPYGLVVHTTGGGAPGRAEREGISPTQWAVRYYKRTRGTHYVNGWGGSADGDLVQVANDRVRAWGVGVKAQRRSIQNGRFEADLSEVLVRLWRRRWPDYANSLSLLPAGAGGVNSVYVHVECPPCVYWSNDERRVGAQPMRPGLRFTKAQHDTVAALAQELAQRHGWSKEAGWWRTPRLVGHEDVTPITRSNRGGGWDPGGLRDDPFFDWDYVYQQIERLESERGTGSLWSRVSRPWNRMKSALGDSARKFFELVRTGRETEAVRSAMASGQRDENTLTNLVFFARHPDRGDRPIGRSERHLAREWIEIRNETVRPMLAGPDREAFEDDLTDVDWNDGFIDSEFDFDEELEEVFRD